MTMSYTIYLGNTVFAHTEDYDEAEKLFDEACAMGYATNQTCTWVENVAGTEVDFYDPNAFESDDCDYEVGFDPYSGCYTDDC